MAFKFFSIGKANAEITAAEDALNPALEKAGIKTITVDGKSVPAAEAPLVNRITALFAVNPPGDNSQSLSDVLVSNETISRRCEKAESDLLLAQTSISSLTREKGELAGKLETAQASVQTLTSEKADLNTRKGAAESQFTANGNEIKAFNEELSRVCIACNCIELKDKDGKALAADATDEQKLAVANKMPWADKLKAYRGAVNSAIAKTGAAALEVPAAKPAGSNERKLTWTEKCLAAVKKASGPQVQQA